MEANQRSRDLIEAQESVKQLEGEPLPKERDKRKSRRDHLESYRRYAAGLQVELEASGDTTELTVYGLPIKGGKDNPRRENVWVIGAHEWEGAKVSPIKLLADDFDFDDEVVAPFELWIFNGGVYLALDPDLTAADVVALVGQETNTRRLALEKAHALQAMADQIDRPRQRERIPQEVRLEVWQRDAGRCIECGIQQNLEFDHIIPFAMGGSNTARNLQLLCGDCNRRKGMTLG